MIRGKLAAVTAGAGVGLGALVLIQGVVFAVLGGYLLVVAPLIGVLVAWEVYRALHRVCSTGSRRSQLAALGGIVLLMALAYFGISFGGFPLLLPALVLAVALALTPRPIAPAAAC